MSVQDRSIPAGEPLIDSEVGNKFSLLSTTEAVNITVFRNNSRFEQYKNVQAPIYGTYEKDFDKIEIESVSGNAQTISFGVTSGRIENPRSQGTVDINSTVPTEQIGGANNLANPPQILGMTAPLTPNTLVTQSRTVCAAGVATVIAPASNVNGVKIHNITYSSSIPGSDFLLAKSSAPSSGTDLAARLLGYCWMSPASNYSMILSIAKLPLILPAGEGLYTIGSGGGTFSVDYEAL